MTLDKKAEKIIRFIPSFMVSILAGTPRSGRTTLAREMAFAWRRKGAGVLYLSAGKEPPTGNCPDLWCRHRPHIPFEDIPLLCEEYEQKKGARLNVLIIDRLEDIDHGHRYGAYFDLKHTFLKLKLFAFEREIKMLLVAHRHGEEQDPPRHHKLTIPFIHREAAAIVLLHKEREERKVTIFGHVGQTRNKLTYSLDNI